MFPIRAIHQIEMTSRCNLRCKYCAHPKMERPKVDMDDRTYAKSLWWASQLHGRELNLAGIGESTMHPEFVRNVFLAREAVGPDTQLSLATNGLLMTPEMARAIAPTGIRVWVSLHRPERAGFAVEALKAAGILVAVSADAAIEAVNWAGQVDWFVSTSQKGTECPWVKPGKVFILADGRVARCCFDATAEDVLGTVDDDLLTLSTSPYKLCASCHHDVGIPIPTHVYDLRRNEAPVNYRQNLGGTSVP
jgi:hypothetical protein